LAGDFLDSDIDSVAVGNDGSDDLTGQIGREWVALGVGEMALQDGRRGALSELGFEDRSESNAPSCPPGPDRGRCLGGHAEPMI
jgi:hypothetical protein